MANPTGKGGFGDNPHNQNRGGRPKDLFTPLLMQKLAEVRQGKERAEVIVEKIITAAEKGQRWAIEYLWDRLGGRARQEMELSGSLDLPKVVGFYPRDYAGVTEDPSADSTTDPVQGGLRGTGRR